MRHLKFLFLTTALAPALMMGACSTNPATGSRQFTALMSPQQETQVGATEHEKIIAQYGLYKNNAVQSYVTQIGKRVTANTERPDVNYTFYVIDSPIVNAFALPGGYIYISRGLLALASSEAELAAVLSHEAGHVTGRHSAARYSRGVVTQLGAGLLGAVLDSQGASQALGLGANLYLTSYSRGQENESDSLGLRYMTRGGYAASEMPAFLYALQRQSELDARIAGREAGTGANYFSTHPATGERVASTRAQLNGYPAGGAINRDAHMNMINGMIYGDSPEQGFARGETFYHPGIGFTFTAPRGYTITNQPSQVVATSPSGSALVFDLAGNTKGQSASSYLQSWAGDKSLQNVQNITVNGMPAATGSLTGQANGQTVNLRLVAIQYGNKFARFQMVMPGGSGANVESGLRDAAFSFRNMTAKEKQDVRPHVLKTFTAKSGDTVASMASRPPFSNYKDDRFRVLNGLQPNEGLKAGVVYKTIVD